jgi:hypothetical protein
MGKGFRMSFGLRAWRRFRGTFDIVVTEYGVADLRGRDDETCIRRMLAVADSEFQPELMATAKQNGKLSSEYEIPEEFRHNRPEKIHAYVERWRARGLFLPYPFGSDFTETEQRLIPALQKLKPMNKLAQIRSALFDGACEGKAERDFAPELARMKLAAPAGIVERLTARALRAALRATARGGTG